MSESSLAANDEQSYETIYYPKGGVPDLLTEGDNLQELLMELAQDRLPVAVDAERASGFRYGHPNSLLQLKTASGKIFLIDTFAFHDLSELQDSLAQHQWILHDGHQDIAGLKELGIFPNDFFDTQIAARLCGFKRFSLAAICEQILGVTLEKDHQAEDWSIRPLPHDWLRYAALDVELLAKLQDALAAQLSELGRSDWLKQECVYLLQKPHRKDKPNRWRRGAAKVLKTSRQYEYLRQLYQTRDLCAQKIDLAPGRLVANQALVEAAARQPRTRRQLNSITAFRSPIARKFESEWLAACEQARWTPEKDLPPVVIVAGPSYQPIFGTISRLRNLAGSYTDELKRVVHEKARQLDIDPALIANMQTLRHLGWLLADYSLAPKEDPQLAIELEELEARQWQQDLILPLATEIREKHLGKA
ncbi:hypothetical protein BK816_04650 [Boudabousia tangfeifanii]|uniref:HRDC domain-containing protein n=1 Tax=Boudabousia tangfeifanii TaxID=1912795 RepID=A0A1D9MK37_9ACTO|nr:HRDC domain-containing protein [Boudabousia tangfeifanii]AOZ72667.1 hypothetical protein BK816_04650 [Boudabousia tangfeifanii]